MASLLRLNMCERNWLFNEIGNFADSYSQLLIKLKICNQYCHSFVYTLKVDHLTVLENNLGLKTISFSGNNVAICAKPLD